MTWSDRLRRIGTAYAAALPNVYHYWRPRLKAPFLVWAENGDTQSRADNGTAEQAVTGTTDYFTADEYDSAIETIQGIQKALGMAWRLESVQYEEETNLIHYEWSWELL